jgi:hypothetical protein
MNIEGYELLISSKADLIKAKQSVNPTQDKDLWDIKTLKGLLNEE